jgi:hypothetical protein
MCDLQWGDPLHPTGEIQVPNDVVASSSRSCETGTQRRYPKVKFRAAALLFGERL